MEKTKNNKGIKLIVAIVILAALIAGMIASIIRYKEKYTAECSKTQFIKRGGIDITELCQLTQDFDYEAIICDECLVDTLIEKTDEDGVVHQVILSEHDDEVIPVKISSGEEIYVKTVTSTRQPNGKYEVEYSIDATNLNAAYDDENSAWDVNYLLTITKTYKEFGIIAIVLLVLIIIDLVVIVNLATKTTSSGKSIYDERQLMARGKAASYGFMVAMIYSIAIALLGIVGINLPLETNALILLGVTLSLGVYVCYAIINDAYFALNQNRRGLLVILGIIAAGSLALTINGLVKGTFITNGLVTWNSALLMLFILVVSIFVTLLIKTISDKKEAD